VSEKDAILVERENSAEFSPNPKFAGAKNEKGMSRREKTGELATQNRPQGAQEGPQAIAGELQVTREGEIAPQSRNGFSETRLHFDISTSASSVRLAAPRGASRCPYPRRPA
jgi:hypothetical protein